MKETAYSEYIKRLLKKETLKRLAEQARIQTAVEGLTLTRSDKSRAGETCFYQPMIAVILQGWKRAMIGNKEYVYGEGSCMAVGVDMPGIYHLDTDKAGRPFLSLSLKLNRYLITQLLAEAPYLAGKSGSCPSAVAVAEVTDEILEAFLRLVKLLEHPAHIPILSPLIIREIHFYVLTGSLGDCLRMAHRTGAQANQIVLAVNWLREHYRETIPVEELARMVNMAPSTFHRRFQQITTLSPLQFQKHLRLYEAERLMMIEGKNANAAALDVGYESVSQFNREYKRQFGSPPLQNITKKKAMA